MSKRKQNTGIELSYQQKIHFSSSKGWFISEVILDAILLTLMLYGCIGGLFSSCDMVTISTKIVVFLFGIVLITILVFDKKVRSKKIMLFYFGVTLVMLYVTWKWISEGAICFASIYVERMNYYLGSGFQVERNLDSLQMQTMLIVFQVFVGWVVTLCYCFLAKMYKRSLIALISPIVIFSLPFVVGLIPELKYLLAFLMGFLPLVIKIKWKDSILGVHVKVVSCMYVGILVFLCAFLLPRDAYELKLDSIREIKQDIRDIRYSSLYETVSYYVSDTMLFQGGGVFDSAGGLNNGTLGNKDKITYNKKTDFVYREYCAPVLENADEYDIYLRSYIGTDYSDKKWHPLSKESQKKYNEISEKWDYCYEQLYSDLYKIFYTNSLLSFDYQEEDLFRYYEITKRDIGRKHMLIPYGNYNKVFELDGRLYTRESYLKKDYTEQVLQSIQYNMKQTNFYGWLYELEYINSELYRDDPLIELEYVEYLLREKEKYQTIFEKEKDYRSFVYDTYTTVPEDVAPRFREEIKQLKSTDSSYLYQLDYDDGDISVEHALKVMHIVNICKEIIGEKAYYSLEPGATPEDKDFIDYFLYENKKGYCSYFATAAVIYLRLCNVPARYVEGYKFSSNQLWRKGERIENKDYISYAIDITDENAHAWVEVYMNGIGWIPVDVTPGLGSVSYDEESSTTDTSISSGENTAMPTITHSPTPSPQVSKETKPATQTDKSENVNDKETKKNKGLTGSQKKVIASILMILILFISIRIRKEYLLKKHKKMELSPFNNARVKFYYRQIDSMTRCLCKLGREQEIGENLKKVECAFSDVTIEELEQLIQIVEKASFGFGQISDYECVKIKILYETIKENLYRDSSFIKELYYKTWKVY